MTEEHKKRTYSRFRRHVKILIWKSYLQRQRRWQILVFETLFAGLCFILAVFIAKPVFLTPIRAEPEPPLTGRDLLGSLHHRSIVGYAPKSFPFDKIMNRAADLLNIELLAGDSEDDLNNILYSRSRGTLSNNSVIWIVWKEKKANTWQFSIRSTERARLAIKSDNGSPSPHLRAGFLGVQMAVSQAILEHVSTTPPNFNISLVSMPVSPLMQQKTVKQSLAGILLCFTLALLPPVLEIEALVVNESVTLFKRALRVRNVSYTSIYVGWIMYAYFTALPICLLAGITLILIFRWIHLLFALITILAYKTVVIMLALIMAMYHNKAWVACAWTMLFTLMQTFLSELMVHHRFDIENRALTFALQIVLPPLGLVHAFNEFALLQTGQAADNNNSLIYPLLSWLLMIAFYFAILMLLQRTIGNERAIGGQKSWKSILFKKGEDVNKLHRIESHTAADKDKLQEVDELVAKAVSFRNVSKSIMGTLVLSDVTFDIYRGEFTMIFANRIHRKMIITIEDLLSGLTFADKGSINVLGQVLKPGNNCMDQPYMAGYCHRSEFLIRDLSVEEHLIFFLEICIWNESSSYVTEYSQIRMKRLLQDCDLKAVKDQFVENLDVYYQAQLCWAIAILLEPRIIIVNSLTSTPTYEAVIKDKIMRYKKYITIVKFCFASIKLEYADRVFLFNNKVLVFGGTPAYLFFKFGREYRVRLTFQSGSLDNEAIPEILQKAHVAGAKVRAHLGSLLILRLPTTPTAKVAALIRNLAENSNAYGITSMNISIPDSEEVCHRAIHESNLGTPLFQSSADTRDISNNALKQIGEQPIWKKHTTACSVGVQLKVIGWKYYTFYTYHKLFLSMTILSAVTAGVTIGISLSTLLTYLEKDHSSMKTLHGELLTVEALKQNTTMVLHLDNSSFATSVAKSYVLSETNSTISDIEKIVYTALAKSESLTEYLITRAIDSPQHYVWEFAYGIDIKSHKNGSHNVRVLYSPLHYDYAAAARSLARAYMALIRHYTNELDATIQVTDNPLALDLTSLLIFAGQPPLLAQFLLILTILHITLLPSKEHGLIRHMQCHSANFSPMCYWFTLFVYDSAMYFLLVVLMTSLLVATIYIITPSAHFHVEDFAILALLLTVYGIGCIPQAYLFSLGPQAQLNSMIFIIVNIIFGETSIIAKILYGNALNYALHFVSFSPQFNMAYAYVKIKKIFLYNTECSVLKTKNLCSAEALHKCCEKCGVLQECFTRQSYLLNKETGIIMELAAILSTSVIFVTLLMLWEYKLIQRGWMYAVNKIYPIKYAREPDSLGVQKEKANVMDKYKYLHSSQNLKMDNFGEYLLAIDVTKEDVGIGTIRNVYLGLGKSEVQALSGLKNHGRRKLCEVLAGYKLPTSGQLWAMSTWEVRRHPHKYACQIGLCSDRTPLPPWMTIFDALELIAILRGVPNKYVKTEVMNYIDALELHDKADTVIDCLQQTDLTKVHFAAAVVGAPPILVLDEFTAYQKYSVRRAMYYILHHLRKRGHAVFISSCSVESHLPVTNRLAMLVNGLIYDIDSVDNLVARYSHKGFTVVLHLKDEVDVKNMLSSYFLTFVINDVSEVLVNVQLLDFDLNWSTLFDKMEKLVAENQTVYSYIVSAIPINYVYNWILANESGRQPVKEKTPFSFFKRISSRPPKIKPNQAAINGLIPFEEKYNLTKLKELPWSVIFQR
ncbi:unnamed protein product [Parnassius mnemosyne]|uniref:ABC transporter domain-containing protein n=1 Tax=Parnassius mnemosyne TaxID=213953 RepID=A0AAV1M1M9_9NEOP